MSIPTFSGVIRRRVLLNYRASPEVVKKLLPDCFTPTLVRGCAMVGMCLMRLEALRPAGLPAWIGLTSENAEHRFAVNWTGPQGQNCSGVFIPRRDTNSHLVALTGGRLFSGCHHYAHFEVNDTVKRISIRVMNKGMNQPLLEFAGKPTRALPHRSVFKSIHDASAFSEQGSTGYSARSGSNTLDGLKLQTNYWQATPFHVPVVYSSFFENRSIFPKGTIAFDHALLMRDIPHQWHGLPPLHSQNILESPTV